MLNENDAIPADGIIGIEFLQNERAELSFHHNTLVTDSKPINPIPFESDPEYFTENADNAHDTIRDDPGTTFILKARTRMKVPIKLSNTELTTGFLPRIQTPENIFMGNALVTNDNGICYIFAVNAYEDDAEINVPPQELIPFEYSDSSEDFFEPDSEENKTETPSNRDQKIRESLRLDHLNSEEREHVLELIKEYPHLFHLPGDKLPATTEIKHTIPTTDDIPVTIRQYRFPPAHKEEINTQVNKLLENNVIVNSASPYNSPLWVVPKKPDSKGNKRWRMVIDFRELNSKTVSDAYPLPNITEILDRLGGAKYFSTFDLASGFHQIEMDPKDRQKTAFSTPNGHYEYARMPFGLKNAPATFQRLMDRVLLGLQDSELFVYLDDIVLFASSLKEHGIKVRRLFDRLHNAKLSLQPDKCEFLNTEVIYLGHIISDEGVRPDPKKTEAVDKFPVPKTATNVRQFLGLAGYYRRFIKNFSEEAKPLSDLLKKNVEFKWGSDQQRSFDHLKKALCTTPVLQYPNFEEPFILTTDASNYAIGAVLSQGKIGEDKPVAYLSRLLNSAEKNYSTTEKECLAVVYAILHFRPYLYGRHFTLVSDHEPLRWIDSVKLPVQRLIRWRIRLREYEYTFVYKPGRLNSNADALSRNPVTPNVTILPISSAAKKTTTAVVPRRATALNPIAKRGRPLGSKNKPLPTVLEESNLPGATIAERVRNRKVIERPPPAVPVPVRVPGTHAKAPPLKTASESSDTEQRPPAAQARNSAFPSLAEKRVVPQKAKTPSQPSPPRRFKDVLKFAFGIDESLESSGTETANIETPKDNRNIIEIDQTPVRDKFWWDDTNNARKNCGTQTDEYTESEDTDKEVGKTRESMITFRHPICRSTPATTRVDEEISSDEEPRQQPQNKLLLDLDEPEEVSEESDPEIIEDTPTKNIRKNSQTIPPGIYYPNMKNEDRLLQINSTNENLTYHRGNYLHFISADCEFTTAISRLLIETDTIFPQDLKFKKPKRNQVLITKKGNYKILSAVLTNKHYDTFSVQEIKEVFQTIKDTINKYQIDSLRMSKPGDMLENFSQSFITELLEECLSECNCAITICRGNVTIPDETVRQEIISEYHESLMGGHKGVTKTYKRIRERFYWPNLKDEVTEYVRTCPECQLHKLTRIKTREPMIITDTPSEPFDKISIDTVGPLPTTPNGNRHILTIQDNLTKYCIAVPIPDIKAETIADALARNVINQFGSPRIILSDQGRSFVGKVFNHLAKIFKIKHLTTSSYHPQTNGSLERSHIVLAEFIKHYVDKYEDWDKLVSFAMFSYNTSVHESTKFTPFELVYGRTARTPSSFPSPEETITYGDYLCDLTSRLDEMRRLASKSLIKSKYRSKRYYDKRVHSEDFKPGDMVYAVKEPKRGKFDSCYVGPYQISEVLDKHNAILETTNGKRILKHLDKLKPYKGRE